MKCCRQAPFNNIVGANFLPEIRCDPRISVRYNSFRCAEAALHVCKKQLGKIDSCGRLARGYKDCIFRESINDCEYCIVLMSVLSFDNGKTCDPIKANFLERFFRDRERG